MNDFILQTPETNLDAPMQIKLAREIRVKIQGTPASDNLYVSDSQNHTIRKIATSTATVTTWVGTAGLSGSADGTGSAARFNTPKGVVSDGSYIYVADQGNAIIRKIEISTGIVTTIAGTAGLTGTTDGTGIAARFQGPTRLAISGSDLYVSDGDRIRKITLPAAVVTTLATGFNLVFGITAVGDNLYVSDQNNYVIYIVPVSTGIKTVMAGTVGISGSADGVGSLARFNTPRGIVSDGQYIYVADQGNVVIRRIEILTGSVTTIAGTAGLTTPFGADGVGANARFQYPLGISYDGISSLYITDNSAHTIRKLVVSSSAVSTFAGTYGLTGSTDATGAAARFNYPDDCSALADSALNIGNVELYCDRVLRFTAPIFGGGDTTHKINKFRLPPECRGESFYFKITGNPNISMQILDAAITEFRLLPKGAG